MLEIYFLFSSTKNDVLHYKNLKLYLRLGLKIKKVNRVLEFDQSKWLGPYIEINTQKRIEAENYGGKDGKTFYKLMRNTAYGKTMKNLRNRIEIRLVNNEKDGLKWISNWVL